MKSSLLIFSNKSSIIHNNKYDYSNVIYKTQYIKVEINCLLHGKFLQTPKQHIRGEGCPKCGIEIMRNKKSSVSDLNSFINEANKIHDNKYNYDKTIFKGVNENLTINCPKHGDFILKANKHIGRNKNGCFKCGRELTSLKLKYEPNKLFEKFNLIHKSKYIYDESSFINVNSKLNIICSKHGLFKQTPINHLKGNGCPKCKSSKGESSIREFFMSNNINFEEQKRFNDCIYKRILPFDFYIPKLNMLVEYQGIQHFKDIPFFKYGLQVQQLKDKIKKDFAINNNYNFIEISYLDNLNFILNTILLNYLQI